MSQRPGRDEELARLSDDTAEHLLARATQLDSARTSGASIAELRRAAAEAGIAPEAFDQALLEMRGSMPETAESARTHSRSHSLMRIAVMVAITLIVFIVLLVARTAVP